MFEAIFASVAGAAASSILGGGSSRSQNCPLNLIVLRPIPAKGRERYGTRHPRHGKITRRICFGRYNSNTYQSSRGDA
jgi:hypothetical protein